jgi:hypothetical protein
MNDATGTTSQRLRELANGLRGTTVPVGGGRYLDDVLNQIAGELEKQQCDHEWKTIETVRRTHARSQGMVTWTCIDRFYCATCLDQRELKREDTTAQQPEWW